MQFLFSTNFAVNKRFENKQEKKTTKKNKTLLLLVLKYVLFRGHVFFFLQKFRYE